MKLTLSDKIRGSMIKTRSQFYIEQINIVTWNWIPSSKLGVGGANQALTNSIRVVQKLTRDNQRVAWAEFSTLS